MRPWTLRLGLAAAVAASAALAGPAATVALVYGVGLAVGALRDAERRRAEPDRSASFVGADGRLVLDDRSVETPAPGRPV